MTDKPYSLPDAKFPRITRLPTPVEDDAGGSWRLTGPTSVSTCMTWTRIKAKEGKNTHTQKGDIPVVSVRFLPIMKTSRRSGVSSVQRSPINPITID